MDNDITGNRVGSKMFPCSKVVTFNTLLKDNGAIPLPRARVDQITLVCKYTVTDAGISAGETLFGALDRVSIGMAGAYKVQFESNEMTPVVTLMGGYATGLYADDMPTTATEAYAYCTIKGPFNFIGDVSPEIFIEMGAITDEWGGASAFAAEFSAVCILSDIQEGPGYVVERQYKPTNTRQDLDKLGSGVVEDIIIVNGTAGLYTTRLEVEFGDKRPSLVFARPYELMKLYASKAHATTTTTMLLENIDIPVNARRRITLTNGTTDTALMFAKNVVSV